ncbi:hypothetical protein LEMLEM_LOCUS454 [Lemmus lemmus]
MNLTAVHSDSQHQQQRHDQQTNEVLHTTEDYVHDQQTNEVLHTMEDYVHDQQTNEVLHTMEDCAAVKTIYQVLSQAVGRIRQEYHKFKEQLGNLARTRLKILKRRCGCGEGGH